MKQSRIRTLKAENWSIAQLRMKPGSRDLREIVEKFPRGAEGEARFAGSSRDTRGKVKRLGSHTGGAHTRSSEKPDTDSIQQLLVNAATTTTTAGKNDSNRPYPEKEQKSKYFSRLAAKEKHRIGRFVESHLRKAPSVFVLHHSRTGMDSKFIIIYLITFVIQRVNVYWSLARACSYISPTSSSSRS